MNRAREVVAVVMTALAGLTIGTVAMGLTRPDAQAGSGHIHGPDTHTHGENGEIIGEPMKTPERPDVVPVIEPVLIDGEIVLSSDGMTEAWIDSAAIDASRALWLAAGGDLNAEPPPETGGAEWWFLPPTEHPLDPRWYVLFTDR